MTPPHPPLLGLDDLKTRTDGAVRPVENIKMKLEQKS